MPESDSINSRYCSNLSFRQSAPCSFRLARMYVSEAPTRNPAIDRTAAHIAPSISLAVRLWPKIVLDQLVEGPGASAGKGPFGQPGLCASSDESFGVAVSDGLDVFGSQARIVDQVTGDVQPLNADRGSPRRPSKHRLILPLQKMQQQHRQAVDEFPLLGLAHALDLLRDVLDVGRRQLSGPQKGRLFIGPRVEVLFVKRRGGFRHGNASNSPEYIMPLNSSTDRECRSPPRRRPRFAQI